MINPAARFHQLHNRTFRLETKIGKRCKSALLPELNKLFRKNHGIVNIGVADSPVDRRKRIAEGVLSCLRKPDLIARTGFLFDHRVHMGLCPCREQHALLRKTPPYCTDKPWSMGRHARQIAQRRPLALLTAAQNSPESFKSAGSFGG